MSRDDVMFWASPDDLQGFSKFIVYKYSGKIQYKTTSSTHAHSFVVIIHTVFIIIHSYLFFAASLQKYAWGATDGREAYRFICEIPITETQRLLQENRDFSKTFCENCMMIMY